MTGGFAGAGVVGLTVEGVIAGAGRFAGTRGLTRGACSGGGGRARLGGPAAEAEALGFGGPAAEENVLGFGGPAAGAEALGFGGPAPCG